jgi:hypothetical protein
MSHFEIGEPSGVKEVVSHTDIPESSGRNTGSPLSRTGSPRSSTGSSGTDTDYSYLSPDSAFIQRMARNEEKLRDARSAQPEIVKEIVKKALAEDRLTVDGVLLTEDGVPKQIKHPRTFPVSEQSDTEPSGPSTPGFTTSSGSDSSYTSSQHQRDEHRIRVEEKNLKNKRRVNRGETGNFSDISASPEREPGPSRRSSVPRVVVRAKRARVEEEAERYNGFLKKEFDKEYARQEENKKIIDHQMETGRRMIDRLHPRVYMPQFLQDMKQNNIDRNQDRLDPIRQGIGQTPEQADQLREKKIAANQELIKRLGLDKKRLGLEADTNLNQVPAEVPSEIANLENAPGSLPRSASMRANPTPNAAVPRGLQRSASEGAISNTSTPLRPLSRHIELLLRNYRDVKETAVLPRREAPSSIRTTTPNGRRIGSDELRLALEGAQKESPRLVDMENQIALNTQTAVSPARSPRRSPDAGRTPLTQVIPPNTVGPIVERYETLNGRSRALARVGDVSPGFNPSNQPWQGASPTSLNGGSQALGRGLDRGGFSPGAFPGPFPSTNGDREIVAGANLIELNGRSFQGLNVPPLPLPESLRRGAGGLSPDFNPNLPLRIRVDGLGNEPGNLLRPGTSPIRPPASLPPIRTIRPSLVENLQVVAGLAPDGTELDVPERMRTNLKGLLMRQRITSPERKEPGPHSPGGISDNEITPHVSRPLGEFVMDQRITSPQRQEPGSHSPGGISEIDLTVPRVRAPAGRPAQPSTP